MSRVGKEPVPVPSGVTVTINGRLVKVKGKLGKLEYGLPEGISSSMEDGFIKVSEGLTTVQEVLRVAG